MNKSSFRLTDREYKVMNVLWNNERDLTINEISKLSDDAALTVACIAQVIPRLLKKELIHVEKFIPVNTKYARTFLPDITRQQYMESELYKIYRDAGIKAILNVIANMNSQAENDKMIQEIEGLLQEYKDGKFP